MIQLYKHIFICTYVIMHIDCKIEILLKTCKMYSLGFQKQKHVYNLLYLLHAFVCLFDKEILLKVNDALHTCNREQKH